MPVQVEVTLPEDVERTLSSVAAEYVSSQAEGERLRKEVIAAQTALQFHNQKVAGLMAQLKPLIPGGTAKAVHVGGQIVMMLCTSAGVNVNIWVIKPENIVNTPTPLPQEEPLSF